MWDSDIALLTLLVAFPLMGVLAVFCIGLLVLQKLRLQTRLDDSSWWLINYSDITIIREARVHSIPDWERAGGFSPRLSPPPRELTVYP